MIFYSVNGGLYFYDGNAGIFIDGLHEGKNEGFSNMPQSLRNDMKQRKGYFANQNFYLFSHEHPDHFSATRVAELLNTDPQAPVYSPLRHINCDIKPSLQFHSWHIHTLPAIHDGADYSEIPLRSCVLCAKGKRYFVASDAILTQELARCVLKAVGGPVTIAFVNFYQVFSSQGQAALELIQPKMVCLYHLPFPVDDKWQVRRNSERAAKRTKLTCPVMVLTPMQLVREE